MFNFKNKYFEPRIKLDQKDPSTYASKGLPAGLSKHWRYSTLDAQNNDSYNNSNFTSSSNNNPINYSNQGNFTSPDDITLEISYDNFYTLGVDMMKKKKYAEELRKQIEEKQLRKKLENQKKKLDDLNDEIRIEKERKIIEDRQKENNKRYLPKINIIPYNPPHKNQNPIKIYTPPPLPSIPLINQNKSPLKPKINTDFIEKYNNSPSKIKYVYRKVYNTEETKNFLKEREEGIEKFDEEMSKQLKSLKKEFNMGIQKLNDEIEHLNRIGYSNYNYRYLLNQKINEISTDIKNNNNKKTNEQIEHIYNVIRKSKDGKTTIQRFTNVSDSNINSFDENRYFIKTPNTYNGQNINIISDELTNKSLELPYINLSHCISYS